MRISQIIIRVGDMERAIEFWSERVGMGISMSVESFAFLDGGGAGLTLNRVDDLSPTDSLTEIVLEFDDVRAAYDDMAGRGVPFEIELRPVTSDGSRELLAAHFRDPDGNLASITGWVG